jgi:hypothetical protein
VLSNVILFSFFGMLSLYSAYWTPKAYIFQHH